MIAYALCRRYTLYEKQLKSRLDAPSKLGNMASAAQNSLLEGCPVFIDRLRNSPRLAQKLKELMLNWGSEEDNPRLT